jgi:hypothetical protein
MSRPPEYENLIKTKAFAAQPVTPGATAALLKNAQEYLLVAQSMDASVHPMQVFSMAYEGFFQVVQAVLEFYTVRVKDSGRNSAIQRVCADLGMSSPEISLMSKAHDRRNSTAYTSPFPPVSKAEAEALTMLVAKYVPVAYTLTNTPMPS